VLYAFKPKAYAGACLMLFLAARRLGLYGGRVVLDTDDWEGDGGWNDRERDRFGPLARWFIAWHERWCLRHADAVTYASRALEPLSRRAGASRLHYVPICVYAGGNASGPVSPFPAGERRDGAGPVVLAYTRLAEFDPARLASTFARIAAVRADVRFLVVGRGLHGEEAAFERAVHERGIADRVVSVGWVAAADLPRYLTDADVALQLLDDNLLTRTKGQAKLLELLVAGVPVVADAVGQANDYVLDGMTGILVPPGDERAMAQAALALLADPDRRRAIGLAAAADVRARWTWEAWMPGLEVALVGGAVERSAFEVNGGVATAAPTD
jgi:glycosyltransferase involved in cell wall biosynthesis